MPSIATPHLPETNFAVHCAPCAVWSSPCAVWRMLCAICCSVRCFRLPPPTQSDQEKEEFCQKIDDLTKQLKKSEEDRLKLYNAQQKFVNMQSQLEEKLKQSEQNRNIVLVLPSAMR